MAIVLFALSLNSCTKEIDPAYLEERNGLSYELGESKPFTGKAVDHYENGQKKSEENYRGGKRDRLSVEWYEHGQKWKEANYKDGELDGLWVNWNKNGQKKSEKNYKAGKLDGLWVRWHENGQKIGEWNFKDGVRID